MPVFALIYVTVVSIIAVVLALRDKNAARKNAWRVKERTLLAVSALGGSAAMLLTMLAVRHKTRRAKFMIGIPLIILAQIAIIVFAFNQNLTVSYYTVETEKIGGRITFALVTDLHSCNYGDEPINAIDAEKPDAILMCGDIFDDELPPDNATEFIKNVSGKYPCYYVSGNHEFWSGKADEFKAVLKSYGVKVLEGTGEVLEIGADKIRIIGVDDPVSGSYAEQIKELNAAANTEMFTILLSHRPERMDELLPLNPDLVLAGHAHGGQWRIPLILENGLYSPNQGLFPKYTNGEYFFGGTELIVSRGLGRESTPVPRMFNRPEIVIITVEDR